MLTREQAITEHRKMWRWIAEQYQNGSKEAVFNLKEHYIIYIYYSENFIVPLNYCFCCEYDNQKFYDCTECPIDFGEGSISCRENKESPYQKLENYCLRVKIADRDSKYMANLALEVANLPEKRLEESRNE